MDIFVHPTKKKSFGYVLIQAMVMGKYVIASNQSGLKAIIEDNVNGFIFECHNDHDLAKKIRIILINTELRSKIFV